MANAPDAKGVLHFNAGVFTGALPPDQVVANTARTWSGTYWTEMVWPLPEDGSERATLMAHELFHHIQGQLALSPASDGDNAQLDTLAGRYLLQLEWRALTKALQSSTDPMQRQAASDALLFRAERYREFPSAAVQERALERNEGLAEYTGVRIGNPTPAQQNTAAVRDLSRASADSSFVRSFAYATGPAYGLLLDHYDPHWQSKLKSGVGVDTLLWDALKLQLHVDLQGLVTAKAAQYDGAALLSAETAHDTQRREVLAHNQQLFLAGPTLTLPFRHMQVQFNPRNLQPLGNAGTVYPTIRISDEWGVLEVKEGALMKPDWSAAIVVAPPDVSGNHISGRGWTLELKPGWTLKPGSRPGDLVLLAIR